MKADRHCISTSPWNTRRYGLLRCQVSAPDARVRECRCVFVLWRPGLRRAKFRSPRASSSRTFTTIDRATAPMTRKVRSLFCATGPAVESLDEGTDNTRTRVLDSHVRRTRLGRTRRSGLSPARSVASKFASVLASLEQLDGRIAPGCPVAEVGLALALALTYCIYGTYGISASVYF